MEKDTEGLIYRAAEQAFLSQGYDGARMQAIADAAGINKALLHYYFRSKEKLYQQVFDRAYSKFAHAMAQLDRPELSLIEKLERFVLEVWKLAGEHTELLLFLQAEIARQRPGEVTQRFKLDTLHITRQIQEAVRTGTLRRAEPLDVLLQLFSLCFYPLQAQGFLTNLLEIEPERYKEQLREYFEAIPQRLLGRLLP